MPLSHAYCVPLTLIPDSSSNQIDIQKKKLLMSDNAKSNNNFWNAFNHAADKNHVLIQCRDIEPGSRIHTNNYRPCSIITLLGPQQR